MAAVGRAMPVGVKAKPLRNMYKTPYLAQRGNIHDLDMMKSTKTVSRSESTILKTKKYRVTWREKVGGYIKGLGSALATKWITICLNRWHSGKIHQR
jgi:hypothetical protein